MKRKGKTKKNLLIDNVLLCAKKKWRGRFVVWALGDPEMKAEAETLERAEELLVEEMWNRYDLDEPFGLKYIDSSDLAPKEENRLMEVVPNESAAAINPAHYFERGFCPVCQAGKGGRNKELLVLEHLSKGVKCGFIVNFQPFFKCGMRVGMRLYHKHICEKLTKLCDPLVEFREVRVKPNRSCDFLELVPKRVIPEEVPAARKGRIGGACIKCGTRFIYAEVSGDHSGQFVSADNASLIRRHGVVAIGDQSSPSICMASDVWRNISKLEEAKGLLTYEISELAEDEIHLNPRFERLTAFKV